MEIVDGEVLYELIFKKYSRDPHGWSFTVSPSASYDFFDALVENEEEAWRLKLDTIYKPTPLVLGATTEVKRYGRPLIRPLQFGFRELSQSLRTELENGEGGSHKLAALLASMEPVVPRSGGSYAEGPFVLTPYTRLDRTQAELDERLSSEMRKLVQKKYPSYG